MTTIKKEAKLVLSQTQKSEKIYNDFILELNVLKEKQNKIINDFIQEVEKAKIQEIKKKIAKT